MDAQLLCYGNIQYESKAFKAPHANHVKISCSLIYTKKRHNENMRHRWSLTWKNSESQMNLVLDHVCLFEHLLVYVYVCPVTSRYGLSGRHKGKS